MLCCLRGLICNMHISILVHPTSCCIGKIIVARDKQKREKSRGQNTKEPYNATKRFLKKSVS